jgi:hypothetical protein
VIVNILVEGRIGDPATVADAAEWRDGLELDFDVLADVDQDWVDAWGNPDSSLYIQHSYTVIGADGRVTWREEGEAGTTLGTFTDALEAALSGAVP